MMYISNIVAQSIVEEIGSEINENINLMDHQGKIIASTDKARIGGLHEGARRIIGESLSELYITDVMETTTTKKGINLPLIVAGEIVGVVGITGERERVVPYGNIVRKITEIMIEDSLRRDARRYNQRMRNRFIEEWFNNSGLPYSREFVNRGLNLKIDINCSYRVVVLYFRDYQTLLDTLDGQKLLEEMENTISRQMVVENGPYLREPDKQFCLYPHCNSDILKTKVKRLKDMIREKYGQNLLAGIDSEYGNKINIQQSRTEAEMAGAVADIRKENIIFYDELDIELFIDEVSNSTMHVYLEKILGQVPKEKWDEYLRIIEIYFTYEGSLTKMSDALFMHKNTLQYKLKKLATYTGRDIRQLSNASCYYIALVFYKTLGIPRNEK
ncbi:carbohydrate diacid regulator [Lachnospiraceae bacterium PF1-22]|uniref:CdaR family transcriptional regulator n=1 Tax=Ohessyouella blattaphilus TaxID=2949333 RepID=UPI003E28394E